MDSNVAAAEARRRAALMQSSLKAVERTVTDKIDAVDRRLRQKEGAFEVFERNVETNLEEITLGLKQRDAIAKEEKENSEKETKDKMSTLFNVTRAIEGAFDRWRGDTKEIAGAMTTKMSAMTAKLTDLVDGAKGEIAEMTKGVEAKIEDVLKTKR